MLAVTPCNRHGLFLTLGGLPTGNEQGLLGMAFHPDYDANGDFYVNLTVSGGTTNIRRYTVSADPDVADPASGAPSASGIVHGKMTGAKR